MEKKDYTLTTKTKNKFGDSKGYPFGRSFGRSGSMRERKPFYRKKWFPLPHKVYQLFQS